jgi:hypothetical protein
MTKKTVLECKFMDFMPSIEIISEMTPAEYQAKKAGKTSKFNMKDSQDNDEEYLIGGWDTIELTPTRKISRNKPQISTQQQIMEIEKDRMTEKQNRSRGYLK